ncbi:MAG TPA: sialidase family protein [Thermoanaerobaculia bacterium]|nr:sialidase family protein [Thermoanaerobaculia bacterium]
MFRCLVILSFALALASPLEARRRAAASQSFPPCSMITGTAAVTFTRDYGRTLTPSAETLGGIGYTYGVAPLDEPGLLLAWHRDDLLLSTDHGCSWRVFQTIEGAGFPPTITPAKGGRAYAWSDNRQFLVRYDSRGVTTLKQPVPFVGLGVHAGEGNHLRAGGDDGTIWDSYDGGETWTQIGALAIEGSVIFYRFAFDPNDLDHIIAGTTSHGAFYTWNGGRTWRPSAGLGSGPVNAFNAVVSPADGDVVWLMALNSDESDQGHPSHGRHIYRSVDGGATFTSVVDEAPGVKLVNGPVMAADPVDPDVLYFVFGTNFQGYGSDLFRFDAATGELTVTHSEHHDINAIAFSRADARVLYLGLEVESGAH